MGTRTQNLGLSLLPHGSPAWLTSQNNNITSIEAGINAVIQTVNNLQTLTGFFVASGTGCLTIFSITQADLDTLEANLSGAEDNLERILGGTGLTARPDGNGFTGWIDSANNWPDVVSAIQEKGASDPLATKDDFYVVDALGQSLTFTSVEDDGGNARFVFSGSPKLPIFRPGMRLMVDGSDQYKGPHTITSIVDSTDKITISMPFNNTDSGTATLEYPGLAVQSGYVLSTATVGSNKTRSEYNGDPTDNDGITTFADVTISTSTPGDVVYDYVIPINNELQTRVTDGGALHVLVGQEQVTAKVTMDTKYRVEVNSIGATTVTLRIQWVNDANFTMRGVRYLFLVTDR